jgi:putative ABC transport system permease protein
MRTFLSRIAELVLRRPREERLSEEVRSHLELLVDEHMSRGLSRDDAVLAARKSFGGIDQVKERYRDQRGFRLIDELVQDVRYAARLIARDRWFTAATVLALSMGIGVSAAMATLVYSMNFRGLPFRDAAALVGVTAERTSALGGRVSFAVFDAWRAAARSFVGLAAEIDAPINLGDETQVADQFGGTYLSHNTFALLGEQPIIGRDFRPDDDRAGAPAVVVIGHRVWADRYGSDPDAIGRTVRINGEPATIIGVMPEGFRYPVDSQVWRPLMAWPALSAADASKRPVRLIGRLQRGVTAGQAEAELSSILAAPGAVSEADRSRRTIIIPLNEIYFGSVVQPVPMMLMTAVLVVLLIACGHAATMLLARSASRTREMSMRAALGAGRARLVRQLLVESVVLSLMAGVVGLGIAAGFVRAFANETQNFGMPYWTRFTFDLPILGIVTLLCAATGVTFGLLPALSQSRADLSDVMNQGGRAGIGGPRRRRTTTILLVGELALTMILLSAASALVRSSEGVYRADHAIELAGLWEYRIALPETRYASAEQRRTFYALLEAHLQSAPGASSAALAASAPFNARESRGIVMDDERRDDRRELPSEPLVAIGDRYFDTLGLRVLRGRRLEDLDPSTRASAALVNEQFAERFSPGVDPIGREIQLVDERAPGGPARRVTIVGIAPPLRQQVANGPSPVVYVPFETHAPATASLIIRGTPERFARSLGEAIRRIDPDLPLYNLQSLERISYLSRWIFRIMSFVFSVVAIIATALSGLGLYALTAYAATQRTQEIGVRMALGAQRLQVAGLFLRQALRTAGIGLTVGLAGAVAVGGMLQGALVGVTAHHPLALGAVAAFLVVVSVSAAVLPARRASRLDPVAALRQD